MLRNVLEITKALSDGTRVRTLLLLRDGEQCVCKIIDVLKMSPATVSKHLSVLRQARLIESRKEGRWVHYRLVNDGEASAVVKGILDWIQAALQIDKDVMADLAILKKLPGKSSEDCILEKRKPGRRKKEKS